MKRTLMVVFWVFFAIAFLYVAGGLVALEVSGRHLMAQLEELEKAGRPVRIPRADPRPPESDNAAPLYATAFKKLEKMSADDLKKLRDSISKPAAGNGEVLTILTQYKSAIDDLASAETRNRCRFGDPFETTLPPFHLAFDVLHARCLYAALNGNAPAALKDYRSLLHLAFCARQSPTMVESAIADALMRSASDLLIHLSKLPLASADWKSLLKSLDDAGLPDRVKRILGLELIASLGELTGVRTLNPRGPSLARRVLFPLRNHAALTYLHYWKDASRLMEEPYAKSKTALAELSRSAQADPLLPRFSPVVALHFDAMAEALALSHARVLMLRLAIEVLASDSTPLKVAEVNPFTGEPWKIVTKDGVWIDGGHETLKLRIR